MKNLVALSSGLLGVCCLALSLSAKEVITCKSPDGKFALRCVYAESQHYNGDTAIVDTATHKIVLPLDPNWTLDRVKLVWSPDSQRVAYFAQKGAFNPSGATRVFFRRDSSFNEIALPDLPSPKLPTNATAGSDAGTSTRIEPIRWSGSRDLLLEKEWLNPASGRAALKITLGFDQQNQPSIRSAEQAKVSIIDYFLLLPPENFEGPQSEWLRMARGRDFFPCDTEPEHNIDEKNGYMSCSGDGAQASFEVALFRYRDRRPLLALGKGEEPELNEPGLAYLQFFEMGANGKMQPVMRWLFPFPGGCDSESGYVNGDFRFDLPRTGKTIVIRAHKSGKILHKVTWNGEKFEKQK